MRLRLLAFVLLAVIAIGCGKRQAFLATPVNSAPVRIVVGRASADGTRLYVEAQVTNTGDKTMTIDRNGVTLTLEDGVVIGRAVGITSTKHPYVLEPGRTRPVHVDFKAEDFKWKDVRKAKLEWAAAISVDGKHIPVEPMPLVARPSEEGEWQ